jgi:membrane-associated phospholipid phosphatase
VAHFIAGHALLLLASAIVLLALAVAAVVGLARAAARHKDLLWSWIDVVVPGHLWRPRTYLAAHLALGLVLMLAATAFAVIAENVLAGRRLAAFDLAFAQALGAATAPAWHSVFWYLTWLGSGPVVATATLAIAVPLYRRGYTLLAMVWSVGQGGAWALNYVLKLSFRRLRPEGADPFLSGSELSFPSGHAMSTFVFAGVAAYLLFRFTWSFTVRVVLISAVLAWSVVMGFSRLYLGVHYLSDVLAGFVAGTAWVAVCVSGAEVAIRRRPQVHGTRDRISA